MSPGSVSGDDRIRISAPGDRTKTFTQSETENMRRATGTCGTITKNPKDNNERAKRQ